MPRAVTITKVEGKPGKVYYPLSLDTVPEPEAGPNDLLIGIHAAALNHRDLFLRQHLYPAISFDVPLLADGCGTVTSTGPSVPAFLKNKRVILTPGRGWTDSPAGPEVGFYAILGGTTTFPVGTLQDVVCVDASEVELAPEHLSDAEAAALPLTGLTAWRAFVTKSGNAVSGRNILVTGIGGGVALNVLQFAVAMGCKVYVTSASEEKIKRAVQMGAAGGVNYKKAGWERDLLKMLPKDRPTMDAIIDGAGGDIMRSAGRILKACPYSCVRIDLYRGTPSSKSLTFQQQGGIVSQYGMTVNPKMEWNMSAVLRNIELRGSTMGSRKEFKDMVEFVRESRIKPVVSRVVYGLDNIKDINGLFEDMKAGKQFGKLVVQIAGDKVPSSKL